ncbi:MAG: phosphatase PAP2 family protein [Clostridia bacterium]
MELLKMLESIRTPFWDKVFSVVTYLGDQLVFMVVVMLVLWCINKKWGYRLFFIGMVGSAINQFLKAIFLIPRPWVLDKNLTIVESAREAATGYSFPSGHTQGAASVFGGIAIWLKRWWVSAMCILLVLLTAFSRMYLGVHTPADVLVSLLTGVLTVIAIAFVFKKYGDNSRICLYGVGITLAVLMYVLLAPKTAANVAEFDADGVKNAYVLMGTMVGLYIAWLVDERWLRYDTKAVWWAQTLKFVIGLALIVTAKTLLKAPLNALFAGSSIADGVRYMLITLIGGALWPLTFRFWGRLGVKAKS